MSPRITPPGGPARYGTPLDLAMAEFETSVIRLEGVDHVTTEAVRLRCARVHACRRCQSVRYHQALEAGFNEELGAKIDDYENTDLDPRLVAALRLVDALILTPGRIDPGLRSELDRHFTRAQIAQILLHVTKFSVQKALVALRLDSPLGAGLTLLSKNT